VNKKYGTQKNDRNAKADVHVGTQRKKVNETVNRSKGNFTRPEIQIINEVKGKWNQK